MDAESAVVYVVRHAEAGARGEGPHDDRRPLTARGREQARVVADLLGNAPVGDILSSPYSRCVETLAPLATRLGRRVVLVESLAEGMPLDGLLGLIDRVADRSVVCIHGDMLSGIADGIGDTDAQSWPVGSFDKGVIWVLLRSNGHVSVAEIIPPAAVETSNAAEVDGDPSGRMEPNPAAAEGLVGG